MKYGDQSVSVVVAAGAATREYVLRWPDRMCRNVPVVFAELDEQDLRRLCPQPDIVGILCSPGFSDCVTMARSVVSDLKDIIVSGDDGDRQIVCGTLDVAARYAVTGSVDLDVGGATALGSISTSDPGTQPDKLTKIVDPFLTARPEGVGQSLSTARTIISSSEGERLGERSFRRDDPSVLLTIGDTLGGEVAGNRSHR